MKSEINMLGEQLQIFVRRFGLLNAACCEECCGEQVSLVQAHILSEIRRQGAPSMQQVAEELGMDVTTFSRQAKSLELKGLINRQVSPDDRRVFRLGLSRSGQELMIRIDRFLSEKVGTVFSFLTPFEQKTVLAVFTLLNEELSRSTQAKTIACCK